MGLITEPWITPDLTGLGDETAPLYVMHCERLHRKSAIQSNKLPSVLKLFNLFSIRSGAQHYQKLEKRPA